MRPAMETRASGAFMASTACSSLAWPRATTRPTRQACSTSRVHNTYPARKRSRLSKSAGLQHAVNQWLACAERERAIAEYVEGCRPRAGGHRHSPGVERRGGVGSLEGAMTCAAEKSGGRIWRLRLGAR
jgi:hypothetical protein